MTLHDRIMAIETFKWDGWNESTIKRRKPEDVLSDAATLAKEADELMAEMGAMLEDIFMLSIDQRDPKSAKEMSELLKKYNAYKEGKQ